MKWTLAALAFLPVALVWGGFVLTQIWSWHVVGVFDVPPLDLRTAVGLIVLKSFLFSSASDYRADKLRSQHPNSYVFFFLLDDFYGATLGLALAWVVLVVP